MKRLLLFFMMAAAAVVNTVAQDIYEGQPLRIMLNSGDSLTAEMWMHGIGPRVIDGEIVWIFNGNKKDMNVKDVKSIELITPEQSMAMARQALVEFYKAMDGDHWTNNTNWCSDKPIDEWHGVMTIGRPYVWYLNLENNKLKGEFPDDGIFSRMGPTASFSLSENEISGPIPPDMAKNIDLQYIQIFNNKLTGKLPSELFDLPVFTSIRINDNDLSGPIPAGIASLMDEKNQLDICGNDFSGEVPEEVVNHPRFHLMWNDIIPQRGHLTLPTIPGYRLSVSDLDGNKFETTDIYNSNLYTLIFNYSSARGDFADKLKMAYKTYKSKGFEVLGMSPGDQESINEYLHMNDISWMNLDPVTFSDSIGKYYIYLNFINLVDNQGNIVFTSIMDDNGKMEDTWGSSTRDQMVFDILADKFGSVDFTPYTSTDFSHDGEVITLQQATVGKGIDIVFIGNGFVDKDMEPGGFYEQKMKAAMDQFFVYEPYTSLRDRFNVYAVKAVSPNAELFDGCEQAIKSDEDAFNYAKRVPTFSSDKPLRVNIIYNSFNAGRSFTWMYEDNSYIAFMLNGVNRVLNHEGGGHGIGRLYDEYVEEAGTTASPEVKDYYEQMWTEHGRGANIDMHSDVSQTRWAHLAADSRYATEKLGAYEGSGTFNYGIYRPTQNSMMRFNDQPFNAPSREAIYKFVMQESEGPDWTYDYETFVSFDAQGRAQYAEAMSEPAHIKKRDDGTGSKTEQVDKQSLPLPPVSIKGSWRDALEQPTMIKLQK